MRADQFDYDAYHRRVERVNATVPAFERGEFLPVCQWTLGDCYGGGTHEKEDMLSKMLDGIAKTLAVENDWMPYLEPWLGIGVFAEAFGCPFEYTEKSAPWTHTIVSDVEGLKRLEKPDIHKSKMLKKVLETTEYFNEQTRGEIAIAATDTQGPLSNMSLICDVTWMLTEAWDYPVEFHQAMQMLTDLIIEFTLEQRKYCTTLATPGHTMWSPRGFRGVSLSDDMLALVGTDFYREFGLPYDRQIMEALGGVGVHSCGQWPHNFKIVQELGEITMVDLAMSTVWDPDPNTPENIIKGFGGSGVPVQVRCDSEECGKIDRLLASDVRPILSYWWNEDPARRKWAYEDTKRRWEQKNLSGK